MDRQNIKLLKLIMLINTENSRFGLPGKKYDIRTNKRTRKKFTYIIRIF